MHERFRVGTLGYLMTPASGPAIRGRREDSTLVIETRNFNGLTQSFAGYGSSKQIASRATHESGAAFNRYEYTITDLDTFSEPSR